MAGAVDIVIVNWNSGTHLAHCLDALDGVSGNIHVIDNASIDGSAEIVSAKGASLTRAPTNLGFGAACNLGASLGNADLILFLNPDTRITADQVSALAQALTETLGAGAIGPALDDGDGQPRPTCSPFPRPLDLLGRMIGADRLGLVRLAFIDRQEGPVDQLIGACLMIKRAEFEALGGFDPRFFLYFEEVDLLRRLKDRGAIALFWPRIRAIHAGHGSSGGVTGLRLKHWLTSRLIYAVKTYGRAWGLLIALASVLIEPVPRVMALALSGRAGQIWGALAAHAGYAIRVPAILTFGRWPRH